MRNYRLSLIKLLFVICIIFMHCGIPFMSYKYFMEGGYIFVDFFFILQGYFLSKIVNNDNPFDVTINYVKKVFFRFFPIVFVETILLLIVEVLFYKPSLGDKIETFAKALCDISFMSVIFHQNFLNNSTLWFLSAYVLIGALSLFLYSKLKDSALPVAFIVAVIIYNYIIVGSGNIDVWWNNTPLGISYATIRAFAGISLGLFIKGIGKQLFTKDLTKCMLVISRFLSVSICVMAMGISILKPHTSFDFLFLIMFGVIILLVDIKDNYNGINKIGKFIEQLTMPMYIFQILAIRIVGISMQPSWSAAIISVLLDIVISILWLYMYSRISGKMKAR